jgi:molybdopterin molybdotransferase
VVSFEEAFEIVMISAHRLGTERVSIIENGALNRVLREDVASDIDIPPFNKSTMDGFACRRADLGNELTVIETVAAGSVPKRAIGRNQCARIMTGAVVPEGADCVIMVEYAERTGENRIRFTGDSTEDHIRRKGEDAKKGDVVIRAGELIRAQHIAVLASVGWVEPLVSARPRVGIITTGSEIVEPGEKPAAGQIRNSNGYQLSAQAAVTGAIARSYGIAEDNKEQLAVMVREAAAENDVVVLSGGVSVGDYDFVREVLKKNGVRLLFERVAVKPGRPMVFGVSDEVFYFGMPGNPVSSFVMFELLVKPFLFKMMGHDLKPGICLRRLEEDITRSRMARDSWLPVVFTGSEGAAKVEYHGSAHINALCKADGLLCMPAGVAEIKAGTIVAVRQI